MIGDNECCKDKSKRKFKIPYEYSNPFEYPKDVLNEDYVRNICTVCNQAWITRESCIK